MTATDTFHCMTLEEVIDHLKKHAWIYYHAPMDIRPVSVKVRQYTVCNEDITQSRATLWSHETKSFTVYLNKHIGRFMSRL